MCLYCVLCVYGKCIVAYLCEVVSPQQREFLVCYHVWFLLGVDMGALGSTCLPQGELLYA